MTLHKIFSFYKRYLFGFRNLLINEKIWHSFILTIKNKRRYWRIIPTSTLLWLKKSLIKSFLKKYVEF